MGLQLQGWAGSGKKQGGEQGVLALLAAPVPLAGPFPLSRVSLYVRPRCVQAAAVPLGAATSQGVSRAASQLKSAIGILTSQAKMSSALVWALVKDHNSFLRHSVNGVTFSAEPGNLTNKNSYKYSGERERRTPSPGPAQGQGPAGGAGAGGGGGRWRCSACVCMRMCPAHVAIRSWRQPACRGRRTSAQHGAGVQASSSSAQQLSSAQALQPAPVAQRRWRYGLQALLARVGPRRVGRRRWSSPGAGGQHARQP